MDRQTDGQMNRTAFIGPFHKDGGLILFFRNLRVKCSQFIWVDCEPYGKNQY